MEECAIYLDFNRHTYLQYRDAGKTRHFVCLKNGSIECVQLQAKDFMRLKKYEKRTPQQFAETYLKSHLTITRQARVILRGILGQSGEIPADPAAASFSGGSVTLEQIAEANQWDATRCRKFLRKAVEKPGGRWAWAPEEAEKIQAMLKEYFTND